MINGIDLLFVVIGFILLLLFVEGWSRYKNWSEWDRDRRRKRKKYRYEFRDFLAEHEYRAWLQFIFKVNILRERSKNMQLQLDEFKNSITILQTRLGEMRKKFVL